MMLPNSTVLTMPRGRLRGTDSNSLLRWYDRAHVIFRTSTVALERAKAGQAVERIAGELRRRAITV
jgi:hypothetical protein